MESTKETTVPQKELTQQELAAKRLQLMNFYKENIKFASAKRDYQKVITDLAELETREVIAKVQFIMYSEKLAKLQSGEQSTIVELTQEDIDKNPELSENGFKAGDKVDISIPLKEQIKKD